jgi:hypothetical protein
MKVVKFSFTINGDKDTVYYSLYNNEADTSSDDESAKAATQNFIKTLNDKGTQPAFRPTGSLCLINMANVTVVDIVNISHGIPSNEEAV